MFKEKEHILSAVSWLGFSFSGDGGMRRAFESAASVRMQGVLDHFVFAIEIAWR